MTFRDYSPFCGGGGGPSVLRFCVSYGDTKGPQDNPRRCRHRSVRNVSIDRTGEPTAVSGCGAGRYGQSVTKTRRLVPRGTTTRSSQKEGIYFYNRLRLSCRELAWTSTSQVFPAPQGPVHFSGHVCASSTCACPSVRVRNPTSATPRSSVAWPRTRISRLPSILHHRAGSA